MAIKPENPSSFSKEGGKGRGGGKRREGKGMEEKGREEKGSEGKGRGGKGRGGKGREGKGREGEGKGKCNAALLLPLVLVLCSSYGQLVSLDVGRTGL